MKKCEVCGTRILFGPVREGRHEYCSYKCRDQATSMIAISTIPNDLVIKNVHEVFRGDCPECGGEGPVDVHISHTVWSIVAMTSFKSNPKICCRRCGRLARIKAALFSSLFGWWGVPWGMLGTPVQILRNFSSATNSTDQPSRLLYEMIQSKMATEYLKIPEVAETPSKALDKPR